MRDRAIELVLNRPSGVDGRNLLREYLQSRILGAMQEAGAMIPLAFMGGTALRFLYRQPRFSVDLDFALEGDSAVFDFQQLVGKVKRQLEQEGYAVTASLRQAGAVERASFGFAGLLFAAGISPHEEASLKILLEVDTNPPAGATLAVTVVDRFGPLRLQHHDLTSLFAGKIAAVIARPYTKGRDLYDLMWYLTREPRIEPNHVLLANALQQTAPHAVALASADWRESLRLRLETVDWVDARRDVERFLEQPRDLELIEPDTLTQLLARSTP
ncbi:MAG: nucleotidyl transferase AbiEii/AbiGii toxin family protein [Coriobacteriia bacterium]